MLLVVMAEQHFPDRIAIALVKQAENGSSFRSGRNTKRERRIPDKYRAERHS